MFWVVTTTADGTGLVSALAPSSLSEGWYTVWGRQIAAGREGPWSGPFNIYVLPPVRRFEPMYWHINMPLSVSASIRTTGPNSVKMDAVLRKTSDIVGMKWSSKDEWDHLQIGYLQSNNYVNVIWEFDFEVTGLPGLDEGQEVSEVPGIIMTVKDDEGLDYYIRLVNYLESGTAAAGHIRLNLAGSPVFGGYDIDDAGQRVSIPWDRIVEFSIGIAPPDYDKDDDTPLAEPLSVSIELSNISVIGDNAYVPRRSSGPPDTDVRMCDGYDDSYNLCPERIVQAMSYLGYSGQYVIYIGASHLHDLVWDEYADNFQINPEVPVSLPSRLWFTDMFERLIAAGFTPVISQSYEALAEFCPEAWQQRDHTGAGARTGWEPPSTLLSPCNTEAMDYLKDVALKMCELLDAAGGDIHYQIGEPWWWDGSYTGGGPCIYDSYTTAAYVSDTSNPVPTPYIEDINEQLDTSDVRWDYIDWCSAKLGDSSLWLRDQVLAEYTAAKTYVLLFTPQILSPTSEIAVRLNLPIDKWEYPAFDVLQLEDYDWIVAGEWDLHALTLSAGTETLSYPLSNIQYFGGFNLNHEDAEDVWPNIKRAIDDALTWGIAEVCVWARPQVFRDGWFPHSDRLAPALGLSPDPGVQYDEPIFPIDLQAKRTSFGDIRMSFNPNQDTTNKTFFVDVYDTGGTNVLRTLTLSSPELVDGRVNADYPIEWNSVDFGFPPTYLVFAVRVGQSDAVGTIVASIEVDNTIVKKAYMFGGQSNALGHFTTLSGATLGEGSAAAFRRSVAAALGLSWIEVMPVQLCWGSSAADVWADDDPVYGENWWYDIDNDEPGPRLTESISALDDLGIPIAGIIWAQGENDASAMNPTSAPRHSTPDRYKTATEKIFAALRAATSSDMPIWIQTCGRGFWGDPPDPPEAGGEYYKAVRDKQVAIAAAQPYTYIGSWVPGCETIAGYVPEVGNPGWVHYTASVYMATAAELAEAVTTPLDRINSRPAWTLLVAPVLTPSVTGFNVRVTWAAGNGATYVVTNLDVVDGTTISETEVSESDGQCNWYFTGAEQVAHYGYAGGYVNVIVYQTKDGVRGPASQLVFNASDLPGYADAPSGLAVAHGSGWDLVYSWDAEPGASYTVVNRNVGDNSVLSTEVVEGDTWTFTGASQISVYGTPAGYVYFEVQKMFDGVPGPAASKTQDISLLSGNPMTAPTGIDAHKSGNDIVVDWDGGGSETFRVRNISVVDSGVISSDVVVGPSWTFDEADQVYEYGFATNNIAVYVARIADGYPGPETYYSEDLS